MVEIATKQRYLLLLKKVRNNQPLTAGELKELKDCEESMAKKATKKTAKKTSASKEAKKAGGSGRCKPSAVTVKNWGLKYVDIPTAEEKEGLATSLAAVFNRWKSLRDAWERGQFLRKLRELGAETNFTIEEAGEQMGLGAGELAGILETDDEAREVFNNARIATIVEIQGVSIQQVRAGNVSPTAARQLAAMMKREVAKKGADFEHLTTEQMEELFGVTRQTVYDWWKKYNAPRNANGTYNLKTFLPWYAQFQLEKAERQPGKFLTNSAEDETTRLRNQKARMQLEEMQRRLVRVDRSMASFLARAAAIDKYIAANGSNLYLKIAGKKESEVKEKLAEYNTGLRQAACQLPANYPEILPPEVAEGFVELMKLLEQAW